MSRRYAPDSPWQNGMPPFGLCQQQFNPMMNCGPMWAQHNLPFMGGSMAPDMRFGGNVSSRSNFRRNYDQPDRYRPRQGFNDRYGNRQGAYNRGDRKRPGPSDRSRSPAPKRAAQGRDGSRKADQDRPKKAGASEEGPAENEDTTDTQNDDLYDPAEPTTEDIADGAEKAEGQDEDESGEGVQEEGAKDEAGGSQSQDESGGTGGGEEGAQPAGKSAVRSGAKPGAKASGSKASEHKSPTKGADGKGQTGGRAPDKARQEGMRKGGQKDKGWCTVCEVHFDGSFLDHRRTEEHKVKRDEKYPKCHPCSMGFNNRKQYEQHCSGDFHRKNVEILDNEVDETAGPLGEEYLEEIPAYFCTLCKLLLKIELKSHHCCTQGHYRRHRDIKRKEEAALKAKLAKEKAEDEEDDTNQLAYTITDEVGSDDEARAASDAMGAAEGTKGPKQDKPDEEPLEASPVKEASDTTQEQPEDKQDGEQPAEAGGDEIKGQDALEEDCEEEKEALEDEAASLANEPKEGNVPDTNGCKNLEEDMEEQKPAVAAPGCSADLPATNADPAPTKPAAPKAAAPKAAAPKVPAKSVPASKATATAPKLAAAATRAPAAKTGTAAGSAAATSAPAASATAAPAPAKKPATVAGSAAAASRGAMASVRGRGAPKAVRARKR
ncbi:zinc finger protein on ecdysone puffs-like [Dermacentor albipictus]|uniref:zinc finger protein on ecdysone puffs-like n=1 Tax=Dermacentor albipictus TaxID=60249 RepID=UPI0031FDB8B4